MSLFQLHTPYSPTGDQPQAISALVENFEEKKTQQVLLGVTGSGKTFTMANVIAKIEKPTLIIAHNKTLAAQLFEEFKMFFPNNAVEYFVSYYDYYQPEAYLPSTDTFIEKDAKINEEIDRLRHSATSSLLERKDVIVVASVSSIYGLGDPREYQRHILSLRTGTSVSREAVIRRLIEMQYTRNDMEFARGTFRVRGDVLEVIPSSVSERSIRVEFFGDEIEQISEMDYVSGKRIRTVEYTMISPASHFVSSSERMKKALIRISKELEERLHILKAENKLVEAQRLEQRTNYDLEMMREMGFCSGIENYSRHLEGRKAGEPPFTLFDYFPKDFLLIVDESHVTIPQIGGMYNGDQARKSNLIEHGFRLPSAADNRPLRFEEFEKKVNQILYVSATPGPYEMEHKETLVEQIIRPTGLLDPIIEIHPILHQIDHLISEIQTRVAQNERTLVTTLTKKMAEDLTNYLVEAGIRTQYLHSDIKTLERISILRDLRLGKFDVLVGINLLREGLDLPEVSLVAILDADKEGFLRSERSLIQTIGRAARNVHGKVILFADRMTRSMEVAIQETERRRTIQETHNQTYGIEPQTVVRRLETPKIEEEETLNRAKDFSRRSNEEKEALLAQLEKEMKQAAKNLQFERAAELRDLLTELKK